MISVSYAKHSDPAVAVRLCAAGLAQAAPQLLLAFCGGKHDPLAARAALREVFGPVPVFGGSAAGAIGRAGFGYSGFELGLIAFHDPAVTPQAVVTRDLLRDEHAAGAGLGAEVAGIAGEGDVVLLLFDSVAVTAPLRLHPASAIVDGFHAGFGARPLCLLGGGLLTDMNLSGGWVFDGEAVVKHAAVALVFPPALQAETAVMHGCRPVSAFMEITRIEGAEVYELDGRPALTVIERMLGLPLGGAKGHELTLCATLGEKQGDPFAPYDENAYVNRLILRANPETGSVTLFEKDFARGTRVQIMSRDNSLMLDSVRRGVQEINRVVAGTAPLLGLYIDCAGRGSARSGAPVEEAALVRDGLDPAVPFLGFYSGVEVAPFAQGRSRPLDWTGVLTVLRRRG
ncbi:FIST signal transduction protein [Roseicella aerolata]|uniref:FIST C-terminal domain-containing protein n=1 Tax=Roseicella aerolata TaxID=2883479 RepID=A0A9X1IJ16_9PROT|nr:FIST C-terminal domain-containing protein [Roseicella aerolata]